MKIKNINDRWGDPVTFDSVEKMEQGIRDCGYDVPEDGLIEGIDYEVISDISAAAALGRVKTEKKAASSRENGKKGGRPAEAIDWDRINESHFFSANQLKNDFCNLQKSSRIIRLIIDQPGYLRGERMSVMKTMDGNYRLYIIRDGMGKWMDASLKDLPLY